MNLKQRLNENDLERIKAAVKNAEEKISGEIVPVIVERSGDYSIALYKGSLIGAVTSHLFRWSFWIVLLLRMPSTHFFMILFLFY